MAAGGEAAGCGPGAGGDGMPRLADGGGLPTWGALADAYRARGSYSAAGTQTARDEAGPQAPG